MKIDIFGVPVTVTDWSRRLQCTAIICAAITIVLAGVHLLTGYFIPGVMPIFMGVTMLLMSTRMFNVYAAQGKRRSDLVFGLVYAALFAADLALGIAQILHALRK